MYVAQEGEEISGVIDRFRWETRLKEVTGALILFIIIDSIAVLNALHYFRNILHSLTNKQVQVVVEDAVSVDGAEVVRHDLPCHLISFKRNLLEYVHHTYKVILAEEYILLVDASEHDVIDAEGRYFS